MIAARGLAQALRALQLPPFLSTTFLRPALSAADDDYDPAPGQAVNGFDVAGYELGGSRNRWCWRAYLGKSTALQIIGGDWFAEQHESATIQRAFADPAKAKLLIAPSAKWIVPIRPRSTGQANGVRPVRRYRPSYGHHAQTIYACVFVGTTNRTTGNRDEDRRTALLADRLQALDTTRADPLRAANSGFAEAVAAHKAHEPHWLMPEQATKIEQEDRFQADPWLAAIIEP